MILPHETLLPQKTVFGRGSAALLAGEATEFGRRGIIVYGRSFETGVNKDKVLSAFPAGSAAAAYCRGSGEPTLDEVSALINKARETGAQWVAGIGGGSVLDLAKAAAGLFNAAREPAFYQEGGMVESKGIPFIAVPTTAGSGSEATPNAVIINTAKRAKLSIRDKSFLAGKVILDAELLRGLPRPVMSCAAMDAFVQAYESFISKNATSFSDMFALRSIELISRNILPACESGDEESAEALLIGSYFAGIAFASARLGVIHGIAHPLGVLYGLPHGLICSACFMPSIKVNRAAMGGKYDIMSRTIGRDLSEEIGLLLKRLKIRSPFSGKKIMEKEKIIEETLKSGSTAANPKPVTRADVEFILREIFA